MVTLPPAEQFGICDRTVLVTGGAGFIGRHLVASLAPANEVHVLDDCSTGDPASIHPAASLRQGDIRNQESLADFGEDLDLLIHLAGLVSVDRSIEVPRTTEEANAAGTLAVLEAARRVNARVVTASSAAVYGEPDEVPLHESDPLDPTSPYGVSKLAADHYTRLYADLYDLPAVSLRYFNVYGPGQTGSYAGVVTVFAEQARAGGPLTVHGDGSQTRDFVHVADVVRGTLRAAASDVRGRAFNVGTGTPTSVQTLAATIRDTVDPGLDIVHHEGRPGDIERSYADIGRARDVLGFNPAVDLADGITTVTDGGTMVPQDTGKK